MRVSLAGTLRRSIGDDERTLVLEESGMPVEKSFLAKIREKELEVSVKIDDVRVEADRMIEQAKKESLAIITSSEVEGKKAADEFLQGETIRIQSEADHIRVQAGEEVKAVQEKGQKNLGKAVERIIAIVLSG
jgi:vacuolar-type H+-ATPase subunit H